MISLLSSLTDTLRGFADLPAALERAIRETNGLIKEARAQLGLLREQAERMSAQLEKMTTIADRLADATAPMGAMAEEARRQMALTTEQLTATNRSLEQIVRFAEPFDRVGKRMVERFMRVTGRGGGEEGSDASGG
jgi:methyl-accepting chemotaxis protein